MTPGDATAKGLYVAYVDPVAPGLPCERRLLMWMGENEGWGYPMSDQYFRGRVHGCVGPLPIMRPVQ